MQPSPPPDVRWRALTRQARPWWKRLAPQMLVQAEVCAPDGQMYFVRVVRNAPVSNPFGQDTVTGLDDAAVATVKWLYRVTTEGGNTGWRVVVVRPAGALRAEKKLFVQKVDARAIVIDVALAVVAAVQRGDQLWEE